MKSQHDVFLALDLSVVGGNSCAKHLFPLIQTCKLYFSALFRTVFSPCGYVTGQVQ